jgi:hypothetical protein
VSIREIRGEKLIMTRNGKIARLPREVRELLNRRLDNGELGTQLVDWLNSLPEVQAVLTKDFGGRPVTDGNVSEWKTGGYRDWQLQQQTLELVRHMEADAVELAQASKARLTDLLAQRLAARCVVLWQTLNQSSDMDEVDEQRLRELCADLIALRKGDHSAERLNLERQRLEFEREQLRELRDDEFWTWAQQHRDEICKGYRTPEEKLEIVRRIIQGPPPDGNAGNEAEPTACPLSSPPGVPTKSE